jgi:hypothetical protein
MEIKFNRNSYIMRKMIVMGRLVSVGENPLGSAPGDLAVRQQFLRLAAIRSISAHRRI